MSFAQVKARLARRLSRVARAVSQSHANERPGRVAYDWFTDAEVAGYEQSLPPAQTARIDDATWRDLDVKALMRRLGRDSSIFGRQWMYARLRHGAAPADLLDSPLKSVDQPASDQILAQTRHTRDALRLVDLDLTTILFHGKLTSVPAWTRHLWIASMLGVAAVFLITSPLRMLGFCLLAAYFVLNAWTQIRLYARLHQWKRQRDALMAMLGSLRAFGEVGQGTPHPILAGPATFLPEVKRLISDLQATWVERTPMLAEYANLFVLYEYVVLGPRLQRFRHELPVLRQAFQHLAQCEAQLCLIEHLRAQTIYCWVKAANQNSFYAEQMTNPLVDDAAPLTVSLQGKGAFITGKNGVGKSTLLRGIGLNVLTARAFGFCYCRQAEFPLFAVWTSIQNEDSLETADSLYMAEMRRTEVLLAVSDRPSGAIIILDEILRGTNHMESVSVSAAVVSYLADRALVFMSSHNLVLAPLLQSRLEPLRIVRPKPQFADLNLEPGVIAETNGIQMMDDYAIADSVRENARIVHDWFTRYVIRPGDFPVLK